MKPSLTALGRKMGLLLLAAALSSRIAMANEQLVFEPFDKTSFTVSEANASWVAQGDSARLLVSSESGSDVLVMPCNSQQGSLNRCVYDHTFQNPMDLSGYKEFALDIYVPDPLAISGITLYFESVGNWAGEFDRTLVPTAGWQTLVFKISDMIDPQGPASTSTWHHINKLRLSAWRGSSGAPTRLLVRKLQAIPRSAVAIVQDSPGELSEKTSEILNGAYIAHDIISVADIERSHFGPTKLIVIPKSDALTATALSSLESYVARGGHIIAQDPIDRRLRALIAENAIGSVVNIASSDRLTSSVDAANHGKTFLALVNRYVPTAGHDAAIAALAANDRVGIYENYLSATAGMRAKVAQTSDAKKIAQLESALKSADSIRASVLKTIASGSYASAIESSRHLSEKLRYAYSLSVPAGPASEVRAVWNHDGNGPFPGNWAKGLKALHDNGFNTIIPNVSGVGFAQYDSTILPHAPEVAMYGDQLATVVKEAHALGIKVHAWDLTWNLFRTDVHGSWFKRLAEHDKFMASVIADASGTLRLRPIIGANSWDDWLSPCDQQNRTFKMAALLEMASKYEIDGIHLDYIRTPGTNALYELSCKARFESETKMAVTNWPRDVWSGELRSVYDKWKPTVITSFVKELHDALVPINEKKRRNGQPTVILSAAVGLSPNENSQDWASWASQGIIDALHPMDYTHQINDALITNYLAVFNERVRKQVEIIGKRIAVYPGIGEVANMPTDAVIAEISATRGDNPSGMVTGGFTLYDYNSKLATNYLSLLSNGATSNKTAMAADVTLTGAIHSRQPGPWSSFDYTLTATNRGPDHAADTTVMIWLPPGVTLDSAVPSVGRCTTGNPIVCKLGSMGLDQASVLLTLTIAKAGSYVVDASIRSDSTDPLSSDNTVSTTIRAAPNLAPNGISTTR